MTQWLNHSILQWLNSSSFFLFESSEHGEVFQRGHVTANFTAGSDLAQEAAHDFSATRFGKCVAEANVVGFRKRTYLFGDPSPKLFFQLIRRLVPKLEGHERGDGLALHLVRSRDDCRLGYLGMGHQSRFHLHGRPSV